MPKDFIALGLFSYNSGNCGWNVASKAGLDGLVARLVAYWSESLSLWNDNTGSSSKTINSRPSLTVQTKMAAKMVVTDFRRPYLTVQTQMANSHDGH